MTPDNSITRSIRLTTELSDRVTEMADADDRSFNYIVKEALRAYLTIPCSLSPSLLGAATAVEGHLDLYIELTGKTRDEMKDPEGHANDMRMLNAVWYTISALATKRDSLECHVAELEELLSQRGLALSEIAEAVSYVGDLKHLPGEVRDRMRGRDMLLAERDTTEHWTAPTIPTSPLDVNVRAWGDLSWCRVHRDLELKGFGADWKHGPGRTWYGSEIALAQPPCDRVILWEMPVGMLAQMFYTGPLRGVDHFTLKRVLPESWLAECRIAASNDEEVWFSAEHGSNGLIEAISDLAKQVRLYRLGEYHDVGLG